MSSVENPNELFVGNLSFFCTEQDLENLFSPFGKASNIRIKRNEKNGRRSLMYGFVCMDTIESATLASQQLHQTMFMGRLVKVELSSLSGPGRCSSKSSDASNCENIFQVHIRLTSHFPNNQVLFPNEEFLRGIFQSLGDLVDVSVKEYVVQTALNRQEGYGFVTFSSQKAAMAAIEHYGNFLKDGIQLECSISHRNFSRSNSSDAGDKMMPLPAIVPELLSGSGSGKHSLRTASYEFDTRSGTTASYEMGNQNSPKPYASSIANNRPFKLPAGRSPQQHYSNQYSPQHQVDSDYNNGVYHQQPVGMNTMIMMPTSSMQPMYTTMAPPGYISHGHPVPPSGPMTGPPDYNNRSQNSYLAPTSPSAASSNPYFAHAGYTQQQPTASAPMNYGNTSYMLPMLPTTNMTSHPTHHPNHTQHHIHPSHQMQPTIRNDHPHYATGNNFPPPAHHSVSFNSGNPQPTMQVDNNQYQYPAAYPHYLNNPTYSMM